MNQIVKKIVEIICFCFKRNSINGYGKQTHDGQEQQPMKYNQKIQHSVNNNQAQKIQLQQFTPQINHQNKIIQTQQIIKDSDYCKYIPQSHKYYNIISQKLPQLKSLFNIQSQNIKPQTQYNLLIKIKQTQDNKINQFIYQFQFPTTYQQYQNISTNYQLQKKFDNNIDQYYCLQNIDQNTKLIYLSYKRIFIISPRDFIYLRYNFKHQDQFWSVAVSLPDAQVKDGKVRGQILLTATKIVKSYNGIKIYVFSGVDMKLAIKPEMAKNRGVTEIKKYLDKCYTYIKQKHSSLFDNQSLNL